MCHFWLALLFCCPAWTAARVLRVDTTGADVGDCGSAACLSLGRAVAQSANGDEILLGPGVHVASGNRNVDPAVLGKANLTIRGAGRDATVIDLQGLGAGPRLMAAAGTMVLEDFTLVNGACNHFASGERHGSGLSLEGSTAIVRRLAMRNMRCKSPQTVFGGDFSGAALFLKDSEAVLEDLVIEDCDANHGSGVASWGKDVSRIYRSTFARHFGRMWGGTLLADQQSRTEYHDCFFTHGTSPYGGHLDDGGTASPLFVNCIFEYGHSTSHGGHFYAYASARSRFYNCEFRHGTSAGSAGGAYLNGDTLPVFQNITFFNNSAATEAGALRSLIFDEQGKNYLELNHVRFIRNSVTDRMIIGAITASGGFRLTDCLFEENSVVGGWAGNMVITNTPGLPTILKRVHFKGNSGSDGGALVVPNAAPVDEERLAEIIMEDCIFEGNNALSDGGAILIQGGVNMTLRNITFKGNRAGRYGGAITIANRDLRNMPVLVQVHDSTFIGNSGDSSGGALACFDPLSSVRSRLELRRSWVMDSRTYGTGAGMHIDCREFVMQNVTFKNNQAVEGSGGAIEFGKQVDCSSKEKLFEDVALHGNTAQQSGGAIFFNHPAPQCAVSGNGSTWNSLVPHPWWWSNFPGQVKGNVATYGFLQGTSPTSLIASCAVAEDNVGESCRVREGAEPAVDICTFPGMQLSLRASLLDSFGQSSADPTLWVSLAQEEGTPDDERWEISGIDRYRFENGQATVADVRLLQKIGIGDSGMRVNAKLQVRLPMAFTDLRHIPPVLLNVTLGNAQRQCPEGYVLDAHPERTTQETCRPCPGGSFASSSTTCTSCEVGRFAEKSGSTRCEPCPKGSGCPAGTTQPAKCAAGFNQPEMAQESCLRCELGKYQSLEGESYCITCPPGQETRLRGALGPEECVCAEDSWYNANTGKCMSCTYGMICPTGSTYPNQTRGFYVLNYSGADDIDVAYGAYRCLPKHCPEGEPGTCSPGRTGLACDSCQARYYSCGSGSCCKCTSGDALPFILGIVVLLALFAALVMFTHTDMANQRLTTLTVISTASQMLVLLQLLALLEGLQLPWSAPLSNIMAVFSLMRFDLEMLRTRCIFSTQSTFTIYFMKVATFPVLILLLLLIFAVSMLTGRKKSTNDVVNCLGTVSMIAFLPTTLTMMEPFMCVSNPSNNSSVRSMPSVLCWQGAHVGILILGALGLIVFTFNIITGVCVVCMFYPQLMATGNGPVLVRRFRFLFQRFKPSSHRYAFTYLLRSLCCSLVPVVIPNSSTLQLLVLGVTAASFGGVQCWQQPWRTWLANIVDALQNVAFQMLLLAAAGTLGGSVDRVQSELAILCTVMLVLVLVMVIMVCVWTALRSCGAKTKPWAAFLSHHKAGAACLARLMKGVITQHTGLSVFLDSDDLIDLDALFETVQCDVSNVIVILTEQTLRRPWCAGELVMAYKYQVPLHPLTFEGYQGLSHDALANLDQLWTLEETHHLTAIGITLTDVKVAYNHLAAIPAVTLPNKFHSPNDLELVTSVSQELIKKCGFPWMARSSLAAALEQTSETSKAPVALLVDLDGTESLAAAGVLRMQLAGMVSWNVSIISSAQDVKDLQGQIDVCLDGILVLLGRRCLQSPNFANAFLAAKSHFPETPVISILADSGFQFPGKRQMDEEIVPTVASLIDVPHERVLRYYNGLMKILAMPLSLHLSMETLKTETHNIVRRLRTFQAGYSAAMAHERSGRFVTSLQRLTGTSPRVGKRNSDDMMSSLSSSAAAELSQEPMEEVEEEIKQEPTAEATEDVGAPEQTGDEEEEEEDEDEQGEQMNTDNELCAGEDSDAVDVEPATVQAASDPSAGTSAWRQESALRNVVIRKEQL